MKRKFFGILMMWMVLGLLQPVKASHIVGGEMTYECLGAGEGNTTIFRIRLDIYQDCITGAPPAIAEDNPAFFGIFTGTNALYRIDSVASSSFIIVPPNFNNACVNNAPTTCLRKATFIKTYSLPNNATGYRIVYQRCCRNQTILNIANPGGVGATYFCIIPPVESAKCNNSAVFQNYPPQIICINNPLVYDHAATDVDGDSLSYEFCETYVGGSPNDAKPYPAAPPYQQVGYVGGFTKSKPMAGNPLVQINPTSGVISGTPNIAGRYVVTVCCHEWRDGVIINTVKREFQFVVTNCSKAVVANIPQYSDEFNTYIVECKSFSVQFDNISTGGFTYFWDFGVPSLQNDTSIQFSPSFTYPDTGTYFVKLVVNRGSTCPDSITRIVKIYPTYTGEFSFDGRLCPNTPVQFTDASVGSMFNANSWAWNFADGIISTEQNPVHSFANGGDYNVVLISKNSIGCSDTVVKLVQVEKFTPFAGNDTIIVKGEHINFRAQGGGSYTWTPATNLSNPDSGNPVGYYPETGYFSYNVHIVSPANQCEGDDSINVRVIDKSVIFVPTGFSPNGDGLNELLRPIGIGYSNVNYFRVFNRWGEQVYYTTKFGEGWNGIWKGKPSDIGTFFWVLSMTNRFGKEEVVKGDATLIR